MVIESLEHRLKGRFEIGEIHDPTAVRIYGAVHVQFDAKRVTVQPRTLVACGNVRQAMCGFDGKGTKDRSRHWIIVSSFDGPAYLSGEQFFFAKFLGAQPVALAASPCFVVWPSVFAISHGCPLRSSRKLENYDNAAATSTRAY